MEIMVKCKTGEGTVPFHVIKDTTLMKDITVLTQQMTINTSPDNTSDNMKIQQYVRLRYVGTKIFASKIYFPPKWEEFYVHNTPTSSFSGLPPLQFQPVKPKKQKDVKDLLKFVPRKDRSWFEEHFEPPSVSSSLSNTSSLSNVAPASSSTKVDASPAILAAIPTSSERIKRRSTVPSEEPQVAKHGRGRKGPSTNPSTSEEPPVAKRGRGRPRKSAA